MPSLLLFLALLLPLAARCREQVSSENPHFNLRNGTSVYIETRECSAKDERLFRLSVKSSFRPPVILKSISQNCIDSPVGNAAFIDVENDGAAYVRITGSCGNGASCESDVYRVSPEGISILHYYSGGTGEFQRVGKYLVTDSRGSCCSWEYLAYDLTIKHLYPIGEIFQYSIYSEAIESTDEGAVLKSRCTISTINAAGKLVINDSPPRELLKFCEHYGKNYVLARTNHNHGNKRAAP